MQHREIKRQKTEVMQDTKSQFHKAQQNPHLAHWDVEKDTKSMQRQKRDYPESNKMKDW